jgi:prolyl-tRNA editing enzyme YbaK/EbsC (Cys-tRNA(Pro) deacylase)
MELTASARTAAEAAEACRAPVGAIVKSLVFLVDNTPVLALIAGDRRCLENALPGALGLAAGKVSRAPAEIVRAATGYAIGGVAPVGHPRSLAVVLDASLGRFDRLFAAAGHPYCVFATNLSELQGLTGGCVSDAISAP